MTVPASIMRSTRSVEPTLSSMVVSLMFESPTMTCSRRNRSASACGSSRVLMIGPGPGGRRRHALPDVLGPLADAVDRAARRLQHLAGPADDLPGDQERDQDVGQPAELAVPPDQVVLVAAVGVPGRVGVVLEQVDVPGDALFAQPLVGVDQQPLEDPLPRLVVRDQIDARCRTRASRTRGGCPRPGRAGRRCAGTRCCSGPTTPPGGTGSAPPRPGTAAAARGRYRSRRTRSPARRCAGPHGQATACAALPFRGDVLRLHELQQAVVTALAAQPGLLDAAERGGRVGDEAAVDARPCRSRARRRPAARGAGRGCRRRRPGRIRCRWPGRSTSSSERTGRSARPGRRSPGPGCRASGGTSSRTVGS